MLQAQGHACHVTSLHAFLRAPQFDHDLYIFHRPEGSEPQLPDLVAGLRSLGRQVRADYDDLIFGGRDIALNSPFVRSRGKDPDRIIVRYRRNLDVLHLFDRVTVSTEPLKDQVLAHHPNAQVEVRPNFIPPSLLKRAEEAGWYKRNRPVRRIGYFAGTKGHSRDFRVAEHALRYCLGREPDTRLLIVGPVDLSLRLRWHRRVERQPLVPYEEMFELMSHCTDVIAPLEDTLFNRCKSRVKYLEATLAGCRLIATPVPDIEAIAGEGDMLPREEAAWFMACCFAKGASRKRPQKGGFKHPLPTTSQAAKDFKKTCDIPENGKECNGKYV
ncbi:glycosyltransferase family protein [Fodinicurvata halophila]|uniref:hypothetical protein n=1 Tax=Fodinicurvata halophila TaxID=1419723 RepID=UPI003625EB71